MCPSRTTRSAAAPAAALLLFLPLGAPQDADAGCPVTVPPPTIPTLDEPIFTVSTFANLTYHDDFTGQIGATATWPAEMGWQGDRIDIRFFLPESAAAGAICDRLTIHIASRFDQSFDLAILVGPDAADLEEVHREFIDSPRTFQALIPACQFTPGEVNLIRLQGIGVQVGFGEAPGILWDNWTLSTVREANLDAVRADQLQRLAAYLTDAIAPSGLVRDSLPLSPSMPPTAPATPDAAGFALLGLAAADHLDLLPDAAERVRAVLRAYAGHAPGVAPQHSADGFWIHAMDPTTGQYAGGGADSAYTPIGAALLVTGARFAANHFIQDAGINNLAAELEATTNFDAAIHPSLDGRVYLSMAASGGGDIANFGTTHPWNEYMLVVSAALRQPGPSPRAEAVRGLWTLPANLPRASYNGISTLTDSPGVFAPAFWVQQSHFFNTDFATDPALTPFFTNHRIADKVYCLDELDEPFRYGLTAGPSPGGYSVERINGNSRVFSPEAVAAWGDMDALLQFFATQPISSSDPRARYGMVRVSALDPGWIPADAPLVDHLFLMFGLVESIDPLFFAQRQPGQLDADADGIADTFDNCPALFNPAQTDADGDGSGDACDCGPDLTNDGAVDVFDLLAYLDLWFERDPAADLVTGGPGEGVDVFDLLAYLDSWFAPPAAC